MNNYSTCVLSTNIDAYLKIIIKDYTYQIIIIHVIKLLIKCKTIFTQITQ